MLRLRTFLDVLERRSSRPGQRLLLLAQDPDEHDEGLKAGGGSLQIKALAVAGESALEQMQGLQGGGHGVVVTADDLLAGSFLAECIIADAVPGHVDAHVSRRLIRAFAVDLFKHCF